MQTNSPTITVELIPDSDLGGYTARIPDIPAYGEGETEDAALADLREAVKAYLEAFGVEDAVARICFPTLRQTDWTLEELVRG